MRFCFQAISVIILRKGTLLCALAKRSKNTVSDFGDFSVKGTLLLCPFVFFRWLWPSSFRIYIYVSLGVLFYKVCFISLRICDQRNVLAKCETQVPAVFFSLEFSAVDLDLSFHFDTKPDLPFHFDPDPDPVLICVDTNLKTVPVS